MAELDPKYVASTRPINRRTAQKQPKQSMPTNLLVQDRIASLKARRRFGAPLAEQLRVLGPATKRKPLSAIIVVGGILSTVSTVGLLLAWIQTSTALAVAGIVGLLASVAMIVHGRRTNGNADGIAVPIAALFDDDCLEAFDRVLEQLAPEVPDAVAAELSAIKDQFIRIARLATTSGVDENYTMEDRMYLTECMRRYLPDSLESYLRVPLDQRTTQVIEEGQTAVSLLLSQINMLRLELTKQETKLTKSTAEELMKQQRFLESKLKR